MSIESVPFIPVNTDIQALASASSGDSSKASQYGSFMTWLAQEMNTVNQQINTAEMNVQQLATGEQDNLHQVMLSIQKAKLGFELALSVRNKLLEGYQEIMRMQV